MVGDRMMPTLKIDNAPRGPRSRYADPVCYAGTFRWQDVTAARWARLVKNTDENQPSAVAREALMRRGQYTVNAE